MLATYPPTDGLGGGSEHFNFFTCSSLKTFFSAVVKQPIGGDMIVEQCRLMLEEQKIDLVPTYKIASKVGYLLSLPENRVPN